MAVNLDIPTDEKTFCFRHPTVETGLRCNNCGKYICSKCAMRTPVGYRCPDCIRTQQNVFFNMNQASYVIAGAVAFVLSLPVIYIAIKLGILLLIIILGIPVGGFISEAVVRAIKKQRGRYTWLVVGTAVVLAGLVVMYFTYQDLFALLGTPEALDEGLGFGTIVQLAAPGLIMTGIVAVTAAARFRYGK